MRAVYVEISKICSTYFALVAGYQVKHGVTQCVHPELQELYKWLEEEFHPLKLAERTAAPVAFMAEKKDLKQYVTAIQDITITRLIKQV